MRDLAQRLRDDLAAVSVSEAVPAYKEARESIDRADAFAHASPSLAAWWSGSNVEGAWSNLGAAREALIHIQDEAVVQAQLPYLLTLATSAADTKDPSPHDPKRIPDRAALAQIIRAHNIHLAIQHGAVRRLRNFVVGLTALLALLMSIAAIVTDQEHRVVVGLGAIAGTLTTVLAVTSAERSPGPYDLLGPQALLKVFAGSATALLAVVLLYNGIGTIGPAKGEAAYFVAVVFGFSQQLFTQLVDNKAKVVLAQATPRSAAVSLGVPPPG